MTDIVNIVIWIDLLPNSIKTSYKDLLLYIYERQRQKERGRGREVFHQVLHSSNGFKDLGYARLKPASYLGSEDPSAWATLCCFPIHITKTPDWM